MKPLKNGKELKNKLQKSKYREDLHFSSLWCQREVLLNDVEVLYLLYHTYNTLR